MSSLSSQPTSGDRNLPVVRPGNQASDDQLIKLANRELREYEAQNRIPFEQLNIDQSRRSFLSMLVTGLNISVGVTTIRAQVKERLAKHIQKPNPAA